MLEEKDINPEKRDDWSEVQNYVKAINAAIAELEHLPLSTRLLKLTHKILLSGVRGSSKLPGEYRTSQNWIGGATLKDAVFIPPHHNEMGRLMGDMENFLHNDDVAVPHLIRIAIAHYQFETIHPFLDGNGRLGRLLITLYLVSNKLLEKPCLYLSDFFEKNKGLYYDNLTLVRTNNTLSQWIKFFLVAVLETADAAATTFKSVLTLKEEIEEHKIVTLGLRVPQAKKLMNLLYSKPAVKAKEVAEFLEVSIPTATRLIKNFIRLDILREITGYKKNRIYIFAQYMDIFRG